jgi:Arm DNA-binding domain
MAKVSQRFTALDIKRLTKPGYHADGAGLYLRIMPVDERNEREAKKLSSKGWIFRFRHGGRTRDMGLGAYPDISLADARELAGNARVLLKDGVDPIEHRKAKRAAERIAAANSVTFDECAREFIKDHEAGWRNTKHRAQWTNTLKTYASPVFGKLPVSEINGGLVLRALKAIWYTKPETASRVRGRCAATIKMRGQRQSG